MTNTTNNSSPRRVINAFGGGPQKVVLSSNDNNIDQNNQNNNNEGRSRLKSAAMTPQGNHRGSLATAAAYSKAVINRQNTSLSLNNDSEFFNDKSRKISMASSTTGKIDDTLIYMFFAHVFVQEESI